MRHTFLMTFLMLSIITAGLTLVWAIEYPMPSAGPSVKALFTAAVEVPAQVGSMRDPWFWLFWILPAPLGSFVCFFAKRLKDKLFSQEVDTWTVWKRGSFMFASCCIALGFTPYLAIDYFSPYSDEKTWAISFGLAACSSVIMDILTSRWLAGAIVNRAKLITKAAFGNGK